MSIPFNEPLITTWPGQLKFAATSTSPVSASTSRQMAQPSSPRASTAAIVPDLKYMLFAWLMNG
jgi:hypothetical protein